MHTDKRTPRRSALLGGCAATVLTLGFGSAAAAQERTPSAAQLEEVVVTAQKREENLQDVPLAVSAVGEAKIAKYHIIDPRDLNGSVPNIQFSQSPNSPGPIFFIRGIGQVEGDPFAATEVGVVVDGVVQGVLTLALLNMFDINNIEVLRGPQGTLFGANTTAGVVNVTTAPPTDTFSLKGRVTVGNYNQLDQFLALNVPLSDKLTSKLVIGHNTRQGFFTNTKDETNLGRINQASFRGYLRYEPTENIDTTLQLRYDRQRDGTRPVVNLATPGMLFYVPSAVHNGVDFRTYSDSPDVQRADSYAGTITTNWASSLGKVTSITNYTDLHFKSYTDYDGTPLLGLGGPRFTNHWQFSQEIRDEVQVSDSLRAQIGAFYLNEHYDIFQDLLRHVQVPGGRLETFQAQHHIAASGFAQVYWDLTSQLQIQAGARYTHDTIDAMASSAAYVNVGGLPAPGNGVLSPSPPAPQPPNPFSASGKESWGQWGWKVAANYKLDQDRLLYAYYARGFKQGGFNGRIATPDALGPFEPEHVDTFEGGFKADWLDNRLRTNVAVFLNKFNNMQIAQRAFVNNVAISTILNAANAESKGAEAEVEFVPVQGLTLRAGVGYLDAKFKEFSNNGVNFAGKPLPQAPKWTTSFGGSYDFPIGPGEASLSGEVNYTGEHCYNFNCVVGYELLPAVTLVNANLSWTPNDQPWSVNFWSKNLLNEKYISAASFATIYVNSNFGSPRQYGVDINFKF